MPGHELARAGLTTSRSGVRVPQRPLIELVGDAPRLRMRGSGALEVARNAECPGPVRAAVDEPAIDRSVLQDDHHLDGLVDAFEGYGARRSELDRASLGEIGG